MQDPQRLACILRLCSVGLLPTEEAQNAAVNHPRMRLRGLREPLP